MLIRVSWFSQEAAVVSLPSPRVPWRHIFPVFLPVFTALFVLNTINYLLFPHGQSHRDAKWRLFTSTWHRRELLYTTWIQTSWKREFRFVFPGSLKKKRDIVSCGPTVQSEALLVFMKSVDEIVPVRQMRVHWQHIIRPTSSGVMSWSHPDAQGALWLQAEMCIYNLNVYVRLCHILSLDHMFLISWPCPRQSTTLFHHIKHNPGFFILAWLK